MTFEQTQKQNSSQHLFTATCPPSIEHHFQEAGAACSSPLSSFIPETTSDATVLQCRMDLMSHWADEPQAAPHPVRDAAHKPGRPMNGFDLLTNGERGQSVAEKKAPSQIVLPKGLTRGMQTAWNQSFPRGDAREQGGLLARNQDGSLKWLPGPSYSSDHFFANYDDVDPHQTLLAVGHTHPYDHRHRHLTDVSFSGDDLADLVFGKQRLSIVQSGEGLFGAARTKEFDALVKARGEDGEEALTEEIRQLWNYHYDNTEGDSKFRSEVATRATSERYHLLYYAGNNGILDKVDTSTNLKQRAHKEHASHPVK